MSQRIAHILIALDQLLFVLCTFGVGFPNETFSSAAWRGERDGRIAGQFFRPIIDVLFWFDPEHCKNAYLNVARGRQLPPSYQGDPQ